MSAGTHHIAKASPVQVEPVALLVAEMYSPGSHGHTVADDAAHRRPALRDPGHALFEGVMLALRNPRAHTLSDDSPEQALEYIALLSLLAKRLDGAKRVREP